MQEPVPVKQRMSIAEYLEAEEHSAIKHEYHDGKVVAMAGASEEHVQVSSNIGRFVGNRLHGKPCRALVADLKVFVDRSRRFFYPDVVVICGPSEHSQHDRTRPQSITNPTVVFEVSSDSTGEFDRTEKFNHYLQVPSLQSYVLVSQNRANVQVLSRQADGPWTITPYSGLDAVAVLPALQIELPLSEIYDGVTFPPNNDKQYYETAPDDVDE